MAPNILFNLAQIRVTGFDAPLGSAMVRISIPEKEAVLMVSEVEALGNALLAFAAKSR